MAVDVDQILEDLRQGEKTAFSRLLTAMQQELRGIAERHLVRERAGHTLQPTALVNEAFLKLIDQRSQNWDSKTHFLSIASTAMRRVLLEHARARNTSKRSGAGERVAFFEFESVTEEPSETILALDEALRHFAKIDPQGARIVELRWFVGLSASQTGEILGVSKRTVERSWRAARAWLRAKVDED